MLFFRSPASSPVVPGLGLNKGQAANKILKFRGRGEAFDKTVACHCVDGPGRQHLNTISM